MKHMYKHHLSHITRGLVLLILMGIATRSFSQTVSLSLGSERSIPADLWGVAGQNTIRDHINWTTKPLLDKLVDLHPMLLRYPGGNIANWWDWKDGWFVQSPYFKKDRGKLTKGGDRPEDFMTAVHRTGATPVWTLNMVSAELQDQLDYLRHVKALGMPVSLVELGSEFYLDGNKYIAEKYPSGADYARECNRWSDSIKKYFPEASCAYLGVLTKGNKKNRRNEWNAGVASAMQHADAITFHVYPQQSNPRATDAQKADPIEILSEPFRAMDRLEHKELAFYPKDVEVWITEYNMNNNTAPVQGSWLHGLYASLLTMKFLEEPRITHTVYFTMCGKAGYGAIFTDDDGFGFGNGPKGEFVPPPNPPATVPWSFSAAGFTMSMYGEVLKGKSNATQIAFANSPHLTCGTDGYSYPALYGWRFTGSGPAASIVLNLSANPVAIGTDGIFKEGSHYEMSDAAAYTYVASGKEITTTSGQVSGALTLQPFSVTRIEEQ